MALELTCTHCGLPMVLGEEAPDSGLVCPRCRERVLHLSATAHGGQRWVGGLALALAGLILLIPCWLVFPQPGLMVLVQVPLRLGVVLLVSVGGLILVSAGGRAAAVFLPTRWVVVLTWGLLALLMASWWVLLQVVVRNWLARLP
jgi:hypothetical protein